MVRMRGPLIGGARQELAALARRLEQQEAELIVLRQENVRLRLHAVGANPRDAFVDRTSALRRPVESDEEWGALAEAETLRHGLLDVCSRLTDAIADIAERLHQLDSVRSEGSEIVLYEAEPGR